MPQASLLVHQVHRAEGGGGLRLDQCGQALQHMVEACPASDLLQQDLLRRKEGTAAASQR